MPSPQNGFEFTASELRPRAYEKLYTNSFLILLAICD